MVKQVKFRWLWLLLGLSVLSNPGTLNAASTAKPAIVLAAFGTTTEAFDTYKHFEEKVKTRFPDYEIRWAFTSRKVRHKVAETKGQKLNDLGTTLRELKAAGYSRVVIQSLHIVPGEEWEKKIVEVSREIPGLKIALGKPLLSSPTDQERVLQTVAQTFPKDLKDTVVVLMAHGSPSPEATNTYLAFDRLLRTHYRNVFLGTVEGKPTKEEAFEATKKANPAAVILMPFMFVAGEHVAKDMLGDDPESWKSELLKQKAYRIVGVTKGLGYQDGIIDIYLDHLEQAMKNLQEALIMKNGLNVCLVRSQNCPKVLIWQTAARKSASQQSGWNRWAAQTDQNCLPPMHPLDRLSG
jgi:sirohydrochlorin cobaltochelatase